MISACGNGISVYRQLQKSNTPFAAGIIYKNDMDYELAKLLAAEVVTEEPFEEIKEETYQKALKLMNSCKRIIVTDVPIGYSNKRMNDLIAAAKQRDAVVILPG